MADQSLANNVWDTIKQAVPTLSNAVADRIRTSAAPGGVRYPTSANPFPGTQGSYPQAEAKPAPGGTALASVFSGMNFLYVAVAVIVFVAVLARR